MPTTAVVEGIASGRVPHEAKVRGTDREADWIGVHEVDAFAEAFEATEATVVQRMPASVDDDFEATVMRTAPSTAAMAPASPVAARVPAPPVALALHAPRPESKARDVAGAREGFDDTAENLVDRRAVALARERVEAEDGERVDEGAPVWMMLIDDELRGPVSLAELRSMTTTGVCPRTMLVRQLKTPAWRPLGEVLRNARRPPEASEQPVRRHPTLRPSPNARREPSLTARVPANGASSLVCTSGHDRSPGLSGFVRSAGRVVSAAMRWASDNASASTRRLAVIGACLAAVAAVVAIATVASRANRPVRPSTIPNVAKATSASPAVAATAPRKPAVDVLREKPDLLIPNDAFTKGRWLARISAFVEEGPGERACPAFKVSGNDEFEKKASRDAADAACRDEMTKAIDFLKRCPATATSGVTVENYDFTAHVFPVTFGYRPSMLASTEGRLWFEKDVLLTWPGLGARGHEAGEDVDLCGVQPGQAEEIYSEAVLRVAVPDPGVAKSARASMPKAIEFAFLLDGTQNKDHFACGGINSKAQPIGHVLAWRMLPTFDWTPATDGWSPPASCDAARTFFGVAKAPASAPAVSATAKPEAPKPPAASPGAGARTATCRPCWINARCQVLWVGGGTGHCCKPIPNEFECTTTVGDD